jgi:hypothetical protein
MCLRFPSRNIVWEFDFAGQFIVLSRMLNVFLFRGVSLCGITGMTQHSPGFQP